MLKRLQTDFHFVDERGSIDQIIHEGYAQVNVITSKAGVIRGGHYHKQNSEAFYVISGNLELTVNGEVETFSAGDFFGIEAGDWHSFRYIEDTVLVSMYSRGVENGDGSKDMFRE